MLWIKNFNTKEHEDILALWNIVVSLEVICLTQFFQIFPDNLTWPIQKMFNFSGIKGKYLEKNELNFGINVINSLPLNLEPFHNTYIFQLLQKLHGTSQVIHPVKLTVKSPVSRKVSLLGKNPSFFLYFLLYMGLNTILPSSFL